MELNWDVVQTRLSTRGPDGKLLPAITGEETDAELRALVLSFTERCPAGGQRSHCPFHSLKHLYRVSLQTLVAGMTRAALLGLFELECEVRNAEAASACPQDQGKLALKPDEVSKTGV